MGSAAGAAAVTIFGGPSTSERTVLSPSGGGCVRILDLDPGFLLRQPLEIAKWLIYNGSFAKEVTKNLPVRRMASAP